MANKSNNTKNQKQRKQLNPYIRFVSTGLQMGLTIYMGNLLGFWLDTKFQTTYLESVVTLFAVFASMYLIISQVLKISKEDD